MFIAFKKYKLALKIRTTFRNKTEKESKDLFAKKKKKKKKKIVLLKSNGITIEHLVANSLLSQFNT